MTPCAASTPTSSRLDPISAPRECEFCNSPCSAISVLYKCGTRIQKFFPKCQSNPSAGWFKGTITAHAVSFGTTQTAAAEILAHIDYDDGDEETLPEKSLLQDHNLVQLLVQGLSNKKARIGDVNQGRETDPGPQESPLDNNPQTRVEEHNNPRLNKEPDMPSSHCSTGPASSSNTKPAAEERKKKKSDTVEKHTNPELNKDPDVSSSPLSQNISAAPALSSSSSDAKQATEEKMKKRKSTTVEENNNPESSKEPDTPSSPLSQDISAAPARSSSSSNAKPTATKKRKSDIKDKGEAVWVRHGRQQYKAYPVVFRQEAGNNDNQNTDNSAQNGSLVPILWHDRNQIDHVSPKDILGPVVSHGRASRRRSRNKESDNPRPPQKPVTTKTESETSAEAVPDGAVSIYNKDTMELTAPESVPDGAVSSALSINNKDMVELVVSSGNGSQNDGADKNNDYSENSEIIPDKPVSAVEKARRDVLAAVSEDSRVKNEGADTLSPEERQKRRECFNHWVKANTDPKTGQGRYVFRRACHKQCITSVLGGSGMNPWPLLKNEPPKVFGNERNPFIEKGQFYVAGNEAWNPFAPRFPGDVGFVNTIALDKNPNQKEFHLFAECTRQTSREGSVKRHWHGPLAVGGRMYLGVYRRVPDEDNVVSCVQFSSNTDLSMDNRKSIAECHVEWDYREHGKGNLEEGIADKYTKEAARLFDEFESDQQKKTPRTWDSISEFDRNVWRMVACLIDRNYTMDVSPVEFVRYDEDLYQCLVSSGCVAETKQTGKKRVSLEADLLQFYY